MQKAGEEITRRHGARAAQDLARGKRSEIDHLNGYVLRQGEALGIATPVNRVLHTLVRALETKSLEPQSTPVNTLSEE